MKFPDRLSALRNLLRRGDRGHLFGIYECQCGWWHRYTKKGTS